MANAPHIQYQAAAAFDGTADKGLFQLRGDNLLGEIAITSGVGVNKDVRITKVDALSGAVTAEFYEKLGTTIGIFVLAGPFRLLDSEWLKVEVSAGAPIRVQLIEVV